MAGGKIDILVDPDLRTFGAKLGAGLRASAGVAASAGRAIGLAVTTGAVAAAAGLKQVVDLGRQYQDSLNTLQAVTGATAQQMAAAAARAKELGSDLTLPATSAVDAAAAMTELAKGGLTLDQAMAATRGTLQLAAAAQIDAAEAATIQSKALNTFSLSASQAGRVADVLANSANASSGEITDYAFALQAGGSVAAQFGVSLEDTATALALFANRGIQGSDAGTLFKTMLQALTDQGKPAQKAIRQLGLTVYDAKGQFVGVPKLFDQLRAAAARMTPAQYQAATAVLFGSDAMRAAGIAATSTRGDWDTLSAAITKTGGASEVAAAKTKGVGGAIEALTSQLETAGLTIFESFSGPLEAGIRATAGFVEQVGGELEKLSQPGAFDAFLQRQTDQVRAFATSVGIDFDGAVDTIRTGLDEGGKIVEGFFDLVQQKVEDGSVTAFIRDAVTEIKELYQTGADVVGAVMDYAGDRLGDVRKIAGNVAAAVRPVATGVAAVLASVGNRAGVLATVATGVGLLLSAAARASDVLEPLGKLLGSILQTAAALPEPVKAVALGLLAFKAVPAVLDSAGGGLGKVLGLTGPVGGALDKIWSIVEKGGEAVNRGLSPMRQFTGEMRVQRALARQAGESLSLLGAAEAAFETSTVGAVAAARRFRDSFRDIQAGAAAAGEPVSTVSAAIQALSEQSDTVDALRDSYLGAAGSVQAFGDRVNTSATRAADALSGKLVTATTRVADGIRAIPGQLGDFGGAIANAVRAGVQIVVDMPGKVAAAGTAMREKLSAAADGAGEAFGKIDSFITEHSDKIQQALTNLGPRALSAVRSLGSSITSGLSSASAAAGRFGTAVATGIRGAVSAIGTLPGRIASAAGAVGTSLRGIPSVISGVVRSAGTGIAALGRAVQTGVIGAFRGIPGAVSGGIGALTRFGSTVAGVGASLGTGLLRAGGSLVSFLGGPWGVAFAAASLGLQQLAKREQEAAQAAAEHKAKIEGLKGTLDQYTGSVTEATLVEQAKDIAARKLGDGTTSFATALRGAGIDLRDFTEAASGNQDKLQLVNAQLFQAAAKTTGLQDLYARWKPRLDEAGVSFETLTAAALGNNQAFDELTTKLGVSGSGFEVWRQDLAAAVGPIGEIGSALGAYNAEVQEASEQTRLAAEASKTFTSVLDGIKIGLGGLAQGAAQTDVLRAGFADLATTAGTAADRAGQAAAKIGGVAAGGAAAAAAMQQSRDAFIEAAQAAGLTEQQAAALADQIGLIPAAAQTIFTTNADGVNAELITLKAQFDAVPNSKQIVVQSLTDDAKARLTDLGFTVTTLPDGTVQVTANTDGARAGLAAAVAAIEGTTATLKIDGQIDPVTGKVNQAVSFADGSTGTITVDGNPDPATGKISGSVAFADGSTGTVTIDGDQKPANGKVDATVTYADGRTGIIKVNANAAAANAAIDNAARNRTSTITVRYRTVGEQTSHIKQGGKTLQRGGIVARFAAGGLAPYGAYQGHQLTPMAGGIAAIVPPNSWRVVGDRLVDDEAYIPINRTRRSQVIFEETARRMGYAATRLYADGGLAATSAAAIAPAIGSVVDVAAIVAAVQQLRSDIRAAADLAHQDASISASQIGSAVAGIGKTLRPNVASVAQDRRSYGELSRI